MLVTDIVLDDYGFQSTPLREGRRTLTNKTNKTGLFQSTPLREGRLDCYAKPDVGKRISIHAPARGATCLHLHRYTHARDFNPRPCARGDLTAKVQDGLNLISIHAPARGATSDAYRSMIDATFQSTPLREGRLWWDRCTF